MASSTCPIGSPPAPGTTSTTWRTWKAPLRHSITTASFSAAPDPSVATSDPTRSWVTRPN